MGLISSILKGSDDAAKAADETYHLIDEGDGTLSMVDDSGEVVESGITRTDTLTEVQAEGFKQTLPANLLQRGVEQPSKIAGEAGSAISGTAKAGAGTALGLGTLYVGGQAVNQWTQADIMESKEQNWEEYQAAVERIRNNDNLSPQEKEERLEQLRQSYRLSQETPGGSGDDDKGDGFLGSLFKGMGLVEQVTLLLGVYIAYKIITNNSGGGN